MTKNTIVLISVLILLAGAYVYWFTDWLQAPTVEILAQIRPTRSGRMPAGAVPGSSVYPVSFAFDRKLELTEVRVVAVQDAKTNKYPHAVWHLISDSNSVPTKALVYGLPVRGMKPRVPKARPEPLLPDTKYRLLVAAGRYKGQIDFQTHEVANPATQ